MSENKTLSIKEQNKSAASSLLKKNVRKFMRNRLAVFGLVVVLIMTLACIGAAVAGIDYSTPNLPAMKQAPSAEHIFGTDTIGRDLFARVLFGGCYSIFIGVFCAVLSSIIGAILGAIAGYFGKGSDWVIVRISEIFLAFPQLVLITHNMGMVAEMADEVCVMYMGRVVEFGSLEDAPAIPTPRLCCLPSLCPTFTTPRSVRSWRAKFPVLSTSPAAVHSITAAPTVWRSVRPLIPPSFITALRATWSPARPSSKSRPWAFSSRPRRIRTKRIFFMLRPEAP